jgi:xylulokinase
VAAVTTTSVAPPPVWVGIDVGTTGAKVVLTGLDGVAVDSGSQRYPRIVAPDGDPLGVEQDARLWWDAVAGLLRKLVAGRAVRGIAVTSQAPSFVPVDAAGDPVGNALLWADRRAQAEALDIAAVLPPGDPLATPADSYFGTAKLLWWARHRPAQLDRTREVLAANAFIVRKLTGASTLDESTATMMQGFREGAFPPALAELGVPVSLLPAVMSCTDVVGTVSDIAAAQTFLPAGTPVAAGGIDAIGTALEAGVLEPGDPFAEMTGFSTVGMIAVPAGTPAAGFIRCRSCVPGVDLVISAQVTTGAVLDWVVALTGGDRSVLDAGPLLALPRPGPLRMVPSLAGERTTSWNPAARGTLSGLSLDTDPIDLVLAAMEGSALELAADVQQLTGAGFDIPLVRSTGGGAVNDAWLQIKADVLGRPVERPTAGSGAAQGAAYLAGLAVGDLTGPADLREFSSAVTARYEPDTGRFAAYRPALEALLASRPALSPRDLVPGSVVQAHRQEEHR